MKTSIILNNCDTQEKQTLSTYDNEGDALKALVNMINKNQIDTESNFIIIDQVKEIDWTRINSDTNGNPRFVCTFTEFIKDGEKCSYELALKRAHKLGGRKFHNKQYGGGIVFKSYNIKDDEKRINTLMQSI